MPRSTRRQGRREAEPEDDDFAWQSPKKKKKGKKSTGRTSRSASGRSSSKTKKTSSKTKGKSSKSRSAEGSSSTRSSKSKGKSTKRKSAGSGSAVRKSGSTRRRRPSGEDDLGNSGRRRRVPAKKKGVDPIVPISIVTATILICIGLALFLRQPPKIVVNEQVDWDAAKKLEEEGMAAYREFLDARKSDQPDLIKVKREEAIHKLRSAVEAMNAILDPKRDQEGMLPPEFEGYERDLSQISRYLIDLEKM